MGLAVTKQFCYAFFFGCRPVCKLFLAFSLSDRMLSSVRPLVCGANRPLAGMVISGLGPNLQSALYGALPLAGFPNPDLFDDVVHSGH